MSRNQRIGLVVAALVVAVVAFVIASPGGEDETPEPAAQTTSTAPSETETEASAPTKAVVISIDIRGGEVAGGLPEFRVTKGDLVLITVASDAPDDIHLHGYDIEKKVEPGKPARFKFTADVEGIFEIESHVAEDAGKDPLVGKLTVEPS